MASTPSDTSVATSVKTRIPLKPRPQYSVEVVDLEILLLLKVEGTPAGFWPLAFVETTNTLEPQALDKLTIFPRLPAELRIKIWKLSAFPRIVMQIMLDPAFSIGENPEVDPLFTPCLPVLMHVNREARDVAGGLYEKIELAFHAGCHQRKCPLYINYEHDIICSFSHVHHSLCYMEFTFSQDIVRRLRDVILLANFVDNIQRGKDDSVRSDLERAENMYQFLKKFEKVEILRS